MLETVNSTISTLTKAKFNDIKASSVSIGDASCKTSLKSQSQVSLKHY